MTGGVADLQFVEIDSIQFRQRREGGKGHGAIAIVSLVRPPGPDEADAKTPMIGIKSASPLARQFGIGMEIRNRRWD